MLSPCYKQDIIYILSISFSKWLLFVCYVLFTKNVWPGLEVYVPSNKKE